MRHSYKLDHPTTISLFSAVQSKPPPPQDLDGISLMLMPNGAGLRAKNMMNCSLSTHQGSQSSVDIQVVNNSGVSTFRVVNVHGDDV